MVSNLQNVQHSAVLPVIIYSAAVLIVKPKKEHMKKVSYLATALMAAWMLQSCGGGNTSNTAQHDDAVDSAKAVNRETAPVDKESSDFAVKAADGGMLEVALGKVAQDKAVNPRVKEFGAMMVRDHSKAGDELKAIAGNKNITLPDSVGNDYQEHIRDMEKKSGKDFDKAYMDMMVNDHKNDIDMFEKAAGNLSDPDLKTFASNTLPTLRTHQDSAKAVYEAVKKK
jgi:putative membrane protein